MRTGGNFERTEIESKEFIYVIANFLKYHLNPKAMQTTSISSPDDVICCFYNTISGFRISNNLSIIYHPNAKYNERIQTF